MWLSGFDIDCLSDFIEFSLVSNSTRLVFNAGCLDDKFSFVRS